MFNWLLAFSNYEKSLIIASIVVALIIFILLVIVFLKPKIKMENYKFIYAFLSGFILIIGTLGLFGEFKDHIFGDEGHFNFATHGHKVGVIFIVIALVVSSFIIAISLILSGKLIIKLIGRKYHKEPVKIYQANKLLAIAFVLLHRIPASITIGFLVNELHEDASLLVVLILHIIPEVMLVYYRMIDLGYSKLKAFTLSFLIKIIFFPLIILGTAINQAVSAIWWIQPLLFGSVAVILTYSVITELMPEFMNYMNLHYHGVHLIKKGKKPNYEAWDHVHSINISQDQTKNKIILKLGVFLLIGMALAVMILMFHI